MKPALARRSKSVLSTVTGFVAAAFLTLNAAHSRAAEQAPRPARSIRNTPHNLSRSSRRVGNTVVAEGAPRICVFCHTPHTAKSATPLWNRESSGVTYKLYGSSTLKGMPRQPAGKSRLCLSCHDGTVAVGAVRRKPRGLPKSRAFRPEGAWGRLAGRPTSLGTDLSDDHPIMVDYNKASMRNEELVPRAALPREMGLARNPTIHCTTCHNPHSNENKPFLVADNAKSRLCTTCHRMKGWRDASHRASAARWNGRGENPFHLSAKKADRLTVAENACEACHKPHGAKKAERLLNEDEERLCLRCHSGNAAKANIKKEFDLPYGHRVGRYAGIHDAYENVDPLGQTLDGKNNSNRTRHAECADCHNPHAAASGVHRPGTNETSNVLRKVAGVKLTYGAARWKAPAFRWTPSVPGASYEYEICMKCHSSWIWESLPPLTTDGTKQTDPSVEFNPNNASFHAVVGASRASAIGDYVPPWNSRSKMYCSDCHRGAGAGRSSGAHGSRVRFLLAGDYDRSTGRPGTQKHLCFSCHRFTTYADPKSVRNWRKTGFASRDRKNLHALHAGKRRTDTRRTVVCRDCHAARPHGIANSRALIVLSKNPAPYRDKDAGIVSISPWGASQVWGNAKKDNCSTVPGCHGKRK